nr:hypothetical protein [Tanacetum cinerariifolium]
KAVVSSGMERGLLSQKGSGGGRGVKEKCVNRNSTNTFFGIGLSTESNDTMNEDTSVGVASTVKEGVTPSAVDLMMEKDKLSSLEDTTVPEPFPPLSTPVTTTGNAPGKFSYAIITAYGFFLGKRVAYPVVANYEDVSTVIVWVKLHVVPVTTFSEDGLSAIATKLGTPLMLDSYTSDMCMKSWGMSSYARVMIELRADVESKDNIVVALLNITREGHYTCNVRAEYEWKPPSVLEAQGALRRKGLTEP